MSFSEIHLYIYICIYVCRYMRVHTLFRPEINEFVDMCFLGMYEASCGVTSFGLGFKDVSCTLTSFALGSIRCAL